MALVMHRFDAGGCMLDRLLETLRPFGFSLELSLVDAIRRDHDDLKEMIELLKDEEVTFSEKKKLYMDFASLLKSHLFSEEKAIYEVCASVEELHTLALESNEEHRLIHDLISKIRATQDREEWMVRVKVLAGLVEHHLLDEESEFLPELIENRELLDEKKMVEHFIELRERSQKKVHPDNAGVLDRAP